MVIYLPIDIDIVVAERVLDRIFVFLLKTEILELCCILDNCHLQEIQIGREVNIYLLPFGIADSCHLGNIKIGEVEFVGFQSYLADVNVCLIAYIVAVVED